MTPGERNKDSEWSSLREEYIEYTLLGELCREFWRRDIAVDIRRAHTDQGGFDIVLGDRAASAPRTDQEQLPWIGDEVPEDQPKAGGQGRRMLVWVFFDRDTLAMDHFRWFGDRNPIVAIPSLGQCVARHTKGNAEGVKLERPGIRTLVWGNFVRVGRRRNSRPSSSRKAFFHPDPRRFRSDERIAPEKRRDQPQRL